MIKRTTTHAFVTCLALLCAAGAMAQTAPSPFDAKVPANMPQSDIVPSIESGLKALASLKMPAKCVYKDAATMTEGPSDEVANIVPAASLEKVDPACKGAALPQLVHGIYDRNAKIDTKVWLTQLGDRFERQGYKVVSKSMTPGHEFTVWFKVRD